MKKKYIDTNKLDFQKLDLKGVKTLLKWAENEGWNPGPHDADVFWATDPDGFYGFFSDNKLIAGGAIVSYNNEFGFMGLFIVDPEYRGNGIGRKLWFQRRDKLLERLNTGASIGMDGVVAMQPFYAKGGFKAAFTSERYECKGSSFSVDGNISEITESDFDQILDYDRQCFGFSRPQFLKPWINLPGNKTFKYIHNNQLKGYSILRKAHTGYKVCPLFADNSSIAEELLKACLNAVNGHPLYIDLPMINSDAVSLIKNYHAAYVFECGRMYYEKQPDIDTNKIFGVTTFELG